MKIPTIISGLLLLASSSAVHALDIGVGVKAGTVGTGAEFSVALTRTINARVSLTDVSADFDETIEVDDDDNQYGIDANLDLDFGAQALLFDWYVFNGTFHLTAGFIKNDSTIKLEGDFTDNNIILNGFAYDVSTDFTDTSISGTVSAGEDFEPYLGIGFGRKAGKSGLALTVDIGVMLMDPSVNLKAPTAVNPADQAQLNADIEEAESAANDEISDLEAYPIFNVGLNYAF